MRHVVRQMSTSMSNDEKSRTPFPSRANSIRIFSALETLFRPRLCMPESSHSRTNNGPNSACGPAKLYQWVLKAIRQSFCSEMLDSCYDVLLKIAVSVLQILMSADEIRAGSDYPEVSGTRLTREWSGGKERSKSDLRRGYEV